MLMRYRTLIQNLYKESSKLAYMLLEKRQTYLWRCNLLLLKDRKIKNKSNSKSFKFSLTVQYSHSNYLYTLFDPTTLEKNAFEISKKQRNHRYEKHKATRQNLIKRYHDGIYQINKKLGYILQVQVKHVDIRSFRSTYLDIIFDPYILSIYILLSLKRQNTAKRESSF